MGLASRSGGAAKRVPKPAPRAGFGPGAVRRSGSGSETRAEVVAARVAATQHGAVSAAQLVAAGLSQDAIERRVKAGVFERVHRGVYFIGPVRGPLWSEHAAYLACGRRATLSHATSLALCDLGELPPVVHVTRPSTGKRHQGVLLHRGRVDERDRTYRHGLPITTPARTLLDIAFSVPAVELARLIEEAQIRRLVTRGQLVDALERGRHRRGAVVVATIATALAADGGGHRRTTGGASA
jgi:hypothetical protein